MNARKDFFSLREVFKKVFKEMGIEDKIISLKIRDVWVELMGKPIEKHTRKIVLKNKVVSVYLNSSVLKQELSFLEKKVIKGLNEKLEGEYIEKIRFL